MAKAKRAKRPTRTRRTTATKTRAIARRKTTKRRARDQATFEAKARAAGRMGGPSIPLRDLIRGGMPRSPKARGGATVATFAGLGAQVRRRTKAAFGTKTAHGTTLMEFEPAPLTHIGTQRAPIRKG